MPSFKAVVKAVHREVGSKVLIDFLFDSGVYVHWPMALKKTKCEVKVLMGPFECVFYTPCPEGAHPEPHPPSPENIRVSVIEYLSQVTDDKQHGCLLDAIEAAIRKSQLSL